MTSRLQVVVVSTRPARKGLPVAHWFLEQAIASGRFDEVELVDLAEVALPLFDEANHPRLGKYEHDHTRRWAAIVARADAFAFVTPEYNFGTPPSLVNALDYLSAEWEGKPVGFVSYGGVSGGTRGVQMSKQLVTALRMVPLVEQVAIPFFARSIGEDGVFRADPIQQRAAAALLGELARWTAALAALRPPPPA